MFVQVYMALSNCRSNGHGLRLRYRLEVFGYASDDLCASGAAPSAAAHRRCLRSLAAVRDRADDRWLSTDEWTTVWRLTSAVVLRRCEQYKDAVGVLATVLSLSAALLTTALQT